MLHRGFLMAGVWVWLGDGLGWIDEVARMDGFRMDSPFFHHVPFHHVPFHHPSCTFSSSITSHLANTLAILTDRKLTLIRIAINSTTAPSRRRAPHFVCAVFPLFPAPAKGSPIQYYVVVHTPMSNTDSSKSKGIRLFPRRIRYLHPP
jgi:hypothetical protein